ncbi:hypothetical protein PUN28_010568 [Cardiocondyla obscurior]
MDLKKRKLLISTSQSFEKVGGFLGISLSTYMGRLYSLALMLFFIFLSRTSWSIICTGHCEKQLTIKFTVLLWYSLTLLLLLSVVGTSLLRPKYFTFPFQEMFMVDSILELYGARFTAKDIFIIKYLQNIGAAVIMLLDIALNVHTVYWNSTFEITSFCLFNFYCRMCMLVMDGLFSHHINNIYLRFRELNKITIQHSRDNLSVSCIDFDVSANLGNKYNNAVVTKIRSIQHLHHRLYILAKKINANFGLQNLIMSVISLSVIIYFLHDAYYNLIQGINVSYLIPHVYLISFHVVRFFYTSYVCQRSKNEFQKMAIILHDAFLEYKSLRAEVVHFSLQLVHENLTFTALGLYEIDIPLMCSVVGAIITYFIMVIQLDTKFPSVIQNVTVINSTITTTEESCQYYNFTSAIT